MNFTKDWQEIQDSWSFFQNILTEIPNEINNCTSIVTDLISYIMGLVATISLTALWTNLQAQAMTIMMSLVAKGTDITVAFGAHDFYRMGQDIGGIINTVINLGVVPDTA